MNNWQKEPSNLEMFCHDWSPQSKSLDEKHLSTGIPSPWLWRVLITEITSADLCYLYTTIAEHFSACIFCGSDRARDKTFDISSITKQCLGLTPPVYSSPRRYASARSCAVYNVTSAKLQTKQGISQTLLASWSENDYLLAIHILMHDAWALCLNGRHDKFQRRDF